MTPIEEPPAEVVALAEQRAVWIEEADVSPQRPGQGAGDLAEPSARERDTGDLVAVQCGEQVEVEHGVAEFLVERGRLNFCVRGA